MYLIHKANIYFMEDINIDWHISKENEAKAKENELRFIFEQAEKQLKESLESGNTVVARTTILLTIIVGIITSIIAAIVGIIKTFDYKISPDLIVLSAILLFLLHEVFELQKTLSGEVFRTLGSQPYKLLDNWYFENTSTDDERYNALYLSEIKSYQRRILKNNGLNGERWGRFRKSLKRLFVLPVYIICLYSILIVIYALFDLCL